MQSFLNTISAQRLAPLGIKDPRRHACEMRANAFDHAKKGTVKTIIKKK
jgi:hypothetical protein